MKLDQSNVPTDIQLLINNSEIAMVLLRIVEIIGEDDLNELGSDTLYFIISVLNQLNIDPIRNNILLTSSSFKSLNFILKLEYGYKDYSY